MWVGPGALWRRCVEIKYWWCKYHSKYRPAARLSASNPYHLKIIVWESLAEAVWDPVHRRVHIGPELDWRPDYLQRALRLDEPLRIPAAERPTGVRGGLFGSVQAGAWPMGLLELIRKVLRKLLRNLSFNLTRIHLSFLIGSRYMPKNVQRVMCDKRYGLQVRLVETASIPRDKRLPSKLRGGRGVRAELRRI